MASEVQLVADFDQLYSKLVDSIQEHTLSVETLTFVVMKAMFLVEQVSSKTKEKGAAKKALVIRLIERLIDELVPEESKEQILSVFHSVGPSVIDAIVEADHTQFLKKANSWFRKVCKCGK